MWTNRRDHVEAILNNSVGYLRIKPDPALYRPRRGPVNIARRNQVLEWLLARVHERIDPVRVALYYPGEAWVGVTPRTPITAQERDGRETSEVVEFLDWLASQTITLYQQGGGEDEDVDVARGIPMQFSFSLDRWAPKDPESISMGGAREISIPQEGGLKVPGV